VKRLMLGDRVDIQLRCSDRFVMAE
jgi:hypothetical protein